MPISSYSLILDNFEQIVEAGPMLSELLSWAPQIKILVTSRTLIRLAAEYDHPVSPLRILDMSIGISRGDIEENEPVKLFLQRARSVKPDFQLTAENAAAVAEICRRLDGLPLAIELAAARIEDLLPEQILAGLGDRVKLLPADLRYLPPRQQTLRGAIDWSYSVRMMPRALTGRTKQFALDVIALVNKLPRSLVAEIIARQLVRASTSVGANYRAAGRGRSRAEFAAKAAIALGEADEAHYWLEILQDSGILGGDSVHVLMKEANTVRYLRGQPHDRQCTATNEDPIMPQ